jgi:hypothetical protein
MLAISKRFAAVLAASVLATAGLAGCNSDPESNRWVTTENTEVKIDWDKVNEAYKAAEGPEDLEKRINEIYEGDEVISISVQDNADKSQIVTGFFDKNTSGKVDEGEKIFTIKREVTGEGQGQVQTTGYGPYAGYHSPFLSIVSGMVVGSMISNALSPRYVPMYTQPYTTNAGRASQLASARASYRTANPTRFSRPATPSRSTGRTYGGGGRSGGGGRFGLARSGRRVRPERRVVA